MRLDRLDLTRYGRFTDTRLNFPAPSPGLPDLHVIFGPNEAGKSTLFSAWLDLLYGIPTRTRYDFLHPGPTMQIGARLTHGGGVLEAIRLKRNGLSLQDANGQPLPEAVMQAALGGLGRDGYTAMFSLDDDTLEQGGDSILASRGDLGEMLFSASAGLSGLGPQLDGLRKTLDAFHKPRARTTTLKAAKDRLQDLDRQRRDLDVTASAAQKLQRDLAAAEKAWLAARATETTADTALKAITQALARAPQQARLARLRAELAPLAALPLATPDDARTLAQIDHALHGLAGKMQTRDEARADLSLRKASLHLDPAILPLADQIAAAAGLYPLHQAALADLPRRRDNLASIEAGLMRQMLALGLTGQPADHSIQPTTLSRLRALVARRDVLMKALTTARDEAERGASRLKSLRDTPGDPPPAEDLNSLSYLVTRLRQSDPEAQHRRAQQDCAERAGDLMQALIPLAPWRGTAQDLAELGVPAPWQITAWEEADKTTSRALRDAQDTLDRRQAALNEVLIETPAASGGDELLAQAAHLRAAREAAWAAHLARMTPQTAEAFEEALRMDDQMAHNLAETNLAAKRAKDATQTKARLTAEIEAAQADMRARHAERQGFEQTLADCARDLGLAGAGLAPDLGQLKAWLALRDSALAAIARRDQAQAALDRADAAVTVATETLATALALPAEMGFSMLWAHAGMRLDTAKQRADDARRLAEAQSDLSERTAALDHAQKALETWQEDWQSTCNGTKLTVVAPADMGLAALLDQLDQLTRHEDERAELANRIAKMEANSATFHAASGAVFAALSLAPETPWAGIADRLAAAQRAAQDDQQIEQDLARLTALQSADAEAVKMLDGKRLALGHRLDWAGEGSLTDHLAQCQRASDLRRAIAELEAELAQHPAPSDDMATLEIEARRQKDALDLARSDTEARFAELMAAKQAVIAIGGDDAVARIATERANLLHDLAQKAKDYLAQRFAVVALEQGLRRYRDSHRSAMLARASDAFRQLSRGGYSGLAAQPDGLSEVLVAQTAKGGAKLATDLSKGTRFQLYLALRIAGYHELAKSSPPVPFIADDIMETFDDQRAEQAFGLLGDMSHCGQVIYLTHHQHLCDIALSACPGARLLDLTAL